MKEKFTKNSILQQICYGFSGAAIIGAYSLSLSAVLGLNLIYPLICCIVCSVFSVKLNNGIFTPDPFFIIPLIYVFSLGGWTNTSISIILGSTLYLIINKAFKKIQIPKYVMVGTALSLAIGGTILLTNYYFGIGSEGATIIEMLKSYRSLGFHPNFMGLLYGTITLFAMITYPFKFKKLNKYLPAEFITILLPFIINLILNPSKMPSAINECVSFAEPLGFAPISFKDINISLVLTSAFTFAILFLGLKEVTSKNEGTIFGFGSMVSGGLSGLPSVKRKFFPFSIISAVVSIILCTGIILIFPQFLSRIPMHSMGAMLIVSLWSNMPYSYFKEAFTPKLINIISIIISILSFLITSNIFIASVILIVLIFIAEKFEKGKV